MRMLFAARDEGEAAFMISLLKAEDIQARVVTAKGEGGQMPPQIWIQSDSDLDRASQIVKDYVSHLEKPLPEGKSWKCGGCNEVHETTFSECWKCGRSRPA